MPSVGPHLPDPPLPRGEEGEDKTDQNLSSSFSLLSLGERRVGEVRADEGHNPAIVSNRTEPAAQTGFHLRLPFPVLPSPRLFGIPVIRVNSDGVILKP
jgi:hypothetical protein